MLSEHPGDEPVYLSVGQTTLRLPSQFNVDSMRGLVGELVTLLGPGAVISAPDAQTPTASQSADQRLVSV